MPKSFRISLHVVLAFFVASALLLVNAEGVLAGSPAAAVTATTTLQVDTDIAHSRSFDPDAALGTSIDVLHGDDVDRVYSQPILRESLSAGWGPMTYRLNTELRIAAWHWNSHGSWSDAKNQSGYFTGDAEPVDSLRHSYAFQLPHRGTTRNDGTEQGYSRITDGDPHTYWKSNPYLTQHFTGEEDAAHPQWVVIDLGAREPVTAIRIAWGEPYAAAYQVQYWTGAAPFTKPESGAWKLFPHGSVVHGKGGETTLRLVSTAALQPGKVRYIRIWMTASSNTCDDHDPSDIRNCVGYAIREVSIGNFVSTGDFIDLVRHEAGSNQTVTVASSIDPWHAESDREPALGDHTGFDLFFTSGITNHLPAMIPVALLYATPEDAAAEIAYLKKRGYPVAYVEMGEEPDGQYTTPEDYATLYLQWAAAIHKVDPSAKLGGPVFEGVNEDVRTWSDGKGRTSWLGRFLDYLRVRRRIADLAFMSFEHYPFEPCGVTWPDLYREPGLTKHILQVWRADGLPQNVPMFITESNIAPELNESMTDIFSALWLADSTASFLEAGGNAYYHSPIQPEPLRSGCHSWSTFGNFVADGHLNIKAHTAQYFASQLINLEWVKHGAGMHRMFPVTSTLADTAGNKLLTAYALERPDGEWSLMVVNRDPSNAHTVKIALGAPGSAQAKFFPGPVHVVTFGSEQYVWRPAGPESHPDPNLPPAVSQITGGSDASFTLPKASITVLRGKVE